MEVVGEKGRSRRRVEEEEDLMFYLSKGNTLTAASKEADV